MSAESLEERIKYLEDEQSERELEKILHMQIAIDISAMSCVTVLVGVVCFLVGFKVGGGVL
jgi:hypothetical protein